MHVVNKEQDVVLHELVSDDLNPKDCTLLWQAVVRQVVWDIDLLISQARQQQAKNGFVSNDKNEALQEILLEVKNPHFQDCCENADLEVSRVREHVKSLVDESNWGEFVFASLVKQDASGQLIKVA